MLTKLILLCGVAFCGVSGLAFNNPVINFDFGCPSVVQEGDNYYLTSSTDSVANNNGEGMPIYQSKDLQTWTKVGSVFNNSNHPAWSNKQYYWAGEIQSVSGSFVVHFVSGDASTGAYKIGVAHSTQILGPYVSLATPLISGTELLDPHLFHSDQETYLFWHDDSKIYTQKLTNDGMNVASESARQLLIEATLPWEGSAVTSPSVTTRNGYYYLFYTGQKHCTSNQVIGVARSKSITGPYEKLSTPIIQTNVDWTSPGSCTLTKYQDQDVIMYESTSKGITVCTSRKTLVKPITWSADWPAVE